MNYLGLSKPAIGGYSQGKSEIKGGAVAKLAFGADRSAMVQDDVLNDGEAESGATGIVRASLINPVEALKKPWKMLGCDSGA